MIGLEFFFLLVFLLLHALFSLAETSVLNIRRSKLQEMIDDDLTDEHTRKCARILLDFKRNPEAFIATVQSGAVLCAFLGATVLSLLGYTEVGDRLVDLFHVSERSAHVIGVIAAILVATILDLTFGVLIPKTIALHNSRWVAFRSAESLQVLSRVFRPFTRLPVAISNILLKPFRDRTSFSDSRITEEEFRVMLEEGARTGVIDKTENELIENIFDFRDRTAREVMVPRTKMVAIDADMPREAVIDRIISEGYTRLPVYRKSIDNILGVIYSKDVLALIEHPDLIHLTEIIRPGVFVPETKLVAELLREFQKQKLHVAVVLDEFGGTAGLITLEDILEEIVGEIHDEYDEEVADVQFDSAQHSAILPANYTIDEANKELQKHFSGFQIPEDQDYESLSGYVNNLFGYIPEVGETHETLHMRVVVHKRAPNRVLQVRFEEIPDAEIED